MVTAVKTNDQINIKRCATGTEQKQKRQPNSIGTRIAKRLRTEIVSDYFGMEQLELRFDLENEQSVTEIHLQKLCQH